MGAELKKIVLFEMWDSPGGDFYDVTATSSKTLVSLYPNTRRNDE